MLRVGLTGGLGSGKSTVLRMLVELGAHGLSADEIGRELMEPGTAVFAAIVARFGDGIVGADGRLNRPELARIAFGEGRVEELNAIVHPATIARQGELAEAIFARDAKAVVVVESALIFETQHGDGWRERFDRLILVTAPEDLKVARFVERAGGADRAALEAEARRRLARMIPDEVKAPQCDFVIKNDGSVEELQENVRAVWEELTTATAS
jgi:dephospho-CoA kinase